MFFATGLKGSQLSSSGAMSGAVTRNEPTTMPSLAVTDRISSGVERIVVHADKHKTAKHKESQVSKVGVFTIKGSLVSISSGSSSLVTVCVASVTY